MEVSVNATGENINMAILSAEGGFTFDSSESLSQKQIEIGARILALPVWYEPVANSPTLYGNMLMTEDLQPITGTVTWKEDYDHLGGGLVFINEMENKNKKERMILCTHPQLIRDGTVVQKSYFFSLWRNEQQ